MPDSDINLFEVDPDSGSVVYVVQDGSSLQDLEKEVNDDVRVSPSPTVDVGNVLLDQATVPPTVSPSAEGSSSLDLLDSGDSSDAVLPAEVLAALADTAASGSIGSSTLEYFDRVISGLSYDVEYIAYRIDSDDSYDAVLYFGQASDISDGSVFFPEATKLTVLRESSGYASTIDYFSESVSDITLTFDQDGSLLFYTNVVPGYPILGGYDSGVALNDLLAASLLGAFVIVIFSKLLFRR